MKEKDIKDIKENNDILEENKIPFCTEPEDPENARNSREDDPCRI